MRFCRGGGLAKKPVIALIRAFPYGYTLLGGRTKFERHLKPLKGGFEGTPRTPFYPDGGYLGGGGMYA
jgi:hypothetical protein